jgi:hypothetical protein
MLNAYYRCCRQAQRNNRIWANLGDVVVHSNCEVPPVTLTNLKTAIEASTRKMWVEFVRNGNPAKLLSVTTCEVRAYIL